MPAFDVDRAYRLHPAVALRPERFGALAYHFGNRRLSFLKTPLLVTVVRTLGDHPSARAALDAANVPHGQRSSYERALQGLFASEVLDAAH